MFLMGSKQRSLKEIIAKNIDAIGYLEGEHVLYFMNLSPGSRIQTRMLGNCGSKIGSAVMHFSYARHSGEERKKWLSLSCTQVPTLVMTSSQRGPAGSAATRLTRPARHSTGREMKIFYYFYSRCICNKKQHKFDFCGCEIRQSDAQKCSVWTQSDTGAPTVCSPLSPWSLIMSVITKTRCSARDPSSNLISELSIQSQAL